MKSSAERSLDDYTLEYCPYCDSEEQVIYAKGITACPNCGKPLAPCSMCESCNYATCPYGCDGSDKDEEKPIDHHITQEEIEWYEKACAEWLKEYQKQVTSPTENEGTYPQPVDNPAENTEHSVGSAVNPKLLCEAFNRGDLDALLYLKDFCTDEKLTELERLIETNLYYFEGVEPTKPVMFEQEYHDRKWMLFKTFGVNCNRGGEMVCTPEVSSAYPQWVLSYKQMGKAKEISCFSKKATITEYLTLVDIGYKVGITDLKVLRNGVDYTDRLKAFLSEAEDKNTWNTILFMLPREPRSYDTADDPGYWTNGDEILCSCEAEASMIADFLKDVFSEWSELDLVTGCYDPFEDAKNNEQDDNTGFWYVRPKGA